MRGRENEPICYVLAVCGLLAGACGGGGSGRGGGAGGGSAGTSHGATAADDSTGSVSGASFGGTATAGGGTGTTTGPAATGSTGAGATTGTAGTGGTATGGASGASTGGAGCVPVSDDELVCDGIDDDCNGLVDDVDVAGDGICDCLSIGILGAPGSLPSADFQQWLADQGTTVVRFGDTPAYVLAPGDLDPYDVVILDDLQKVFDAQEQAVFQAWLDGGGRFMSMAGYVNNVQDRDEQNSLASLSGLSYVGTAVLLEPQTAWAMHPISEGLGTVRFLGGWVVDGVGDTVMYVAGDPATRLGVTVDNGTFRAFVYGDEWVSFDSEWTNYPSVPVFWENVLKWLSPAGFCFTPQ